MHVVLATHSTIEFGQENVEIFNPDAFLAGFDSSSIDYKDL